MRKKFIKVTIVRNEGTEDNDENIFEEYYILEDEFIRWAIKQMHLGWVVTCEYTVIFCSPKEVEIPKIIQIES